MRLRRPTEQSALGSRHQLARRVRGRRQGRPHQEGQRCRRALQSKISQTLAIRQKRRRSPPPGACRRPARGRQGFASHGPARLKRVDDRRRFPSRLRTCRRPYDRRRSSQDPVDGVSTDGLQMRLFDRSHLGARPSFRHRLSRRGSTLWPRRTERGWRPMACKGCILGAGDEGAFMALSAYRSSRSNARGARRKVKPPALRPGLFGHLDGVGRRRDISRLSALLTRRSCTEGTFRSGSGSAS